VIEDVSSQRRYARRCDTEDGMVKIEAVLHPEEAEMVWAMLDHAVAQLAREPRSPSGGDSAESGAAPRLHATLTGPAPAPAPGMRDGSDAAESGAAPRLHATLAGPAPEPAPGMRDGSDVVACLIEAAVTGNSSLPKRRFCEIDRSHEPCCQAAISDSMVLRHPRSRMRWVGSSVRCGARGRIGRRRRQSGRGRGERRVLPAVLGRAAAIRPRSTPRRSPGHGTARRWTTTDHGAPRDRR
jgi:hypothetical protein